MESINVLVIGANFSNKGAEAMIETVLEQLSKRYRVTLYMVCRDYESELAERAGFIPVFNNSSGFVMRYHDLRHQVLGKFKKMFSLGKQDWFFPLPFNKIDAMLKDIDAVIDVSGFAYADSWGKALITETLKLMRRCEQKMIPFYFMPQAWGGFEQPAVAKAASQMLRKATGFYARDPQSRHHLAKLLNRPDTQIPIANDMVFTFEQMALAPSVLRRQYTKQLIIGISPNLRVYEKLEGEGEQNAYLKLLYRITEKLITEYDALIYLIPNELFPDGKAHRDDRFLCEMIATYINDETRVYYNPSYASAVQIKALIGQVDILVSSRFHALIFGFLQAKPSLAISWSHKYKELFRIFRQEEFVLESDDLVFDVAWERLERLISQRFVRSMEIEQRLKPAKAKVNSLFAELVDSIHDFLHKSK